MGTGWLKREIEVVQKEVSNWPEWKKATATNQPTEQQAKQASTREIGSNLPKK